MDRRTRLRNFYLDQIEAWETGQKATPGQPVESENYARNMREERKRLLAEIANLNDGATNPDTPRSKIMPKRVQKSGLVERLGTAGHKAHEAVKGNKTKFDTAARLPAGIEGGVAKLVQIGFKQFQRGDNKGEYFFSAAGVVISPEMHNGVPIRGQHTRIGPEPLCDTPSRNPDRPRSRETLQDHLDWVYNELRKLGVETSEVEFDQLEAVAAALEEEGPLFRFRTWQGQPTSDFPDPRVNEVWNGLCEAEVPDTAAGAVEENGADKPDEQDAPFGDLAELAAKADANDSGAAAQLMQMALEAGVSQNTIDNAPSWASVVEMVEGEGEEEEEEEEGVHRYLADGEAADNGDEGAIARLEAAAAAANIDDTEYSTWVELADALAAEGGEEDEESSPPTKGDVFQYKPPKSRKLINVEVTAVFEGAETANVKSIDDGKLYRSVPWTDLVG